MVKREREKHSSQIDKSNEKENNSRLLSASNSPTEDLIVTLSDAYENKRARQVVEWETLGRRELHQNQQRAT